jgi:tetratricopeptide (TPR) repeat protein
MRRHAGPGNAVALAAFLLGAFSEPASAAAAFPPDADRWIQVQTAHFVLYSNASERRTLDLGKRLERFRATLSRFNKKFRVDPPATTSIYVFKDDASLTPYKMRFNGRPVELSGLFAGHPDGYYIILNGAKQGDPLQIIYHEYTHHFLENNLHNVPAWFNEGLAECYSTFRGDEKTASIGLTQNDHVLLLREHDLMPLHDLFSITAESADYNEGERRGVFYAESWALMHYLMWDKPERRPQFLRFLERLGRGENPDTAFSASFETTYKTLEYELRNHVRQARFTYAVFNVSDLAIDDTVKVAAMKREEVLVRLGDLLVHIDRDRASEAAEYFHEAQRLSPGYAAADAGLAYLACLAERYDEAIELYDRVMGRDPDDPETCFHFGQCLARRPPAALTGGGDGGLPPQLVRALEMFGKAIQMRPTFAEAYVEYASVLATNGQNPASAIHLLEAARQLLPSRIDIVENLATLYARQGDGARARDLVDNVLAQMNDREALERARNRVQLEEGRSRARKSAAAPQTAATESATEASDAPPDDSPPPLPEYPPTGIGDRADDMAAYNRQVAAYNKAVEHANLRDYKGAIAILEDLLRQVKDDGLRERIKTFLDLLRKEIARVQKPRG